VSKTILKSNYFSLSICLKA